jgi:CHAT domain-containing protein
MAPEALIEQLLALPNLEAQRQFLEEHVSRLDDSLADGLKQHADRFLRSDVQRSLQTASLLVHAGQLVDEPCYRALGLLAEANCRCLGGLGEYQRAIELYDEAADIYEAQGQPAAQARSQIGKLYALAFLGRYDQAVATGEWAIPILEKHGEWRPLAHMKVNLGLIQGRRGEDVKALALFDRATEIYRQIGEEIPFVPMVDQNRAIVLRNLGQFEASIQASRDAWETLTEIGQTAEAARAQQNLAVTYFVLGRYNEALKLLDEVLEVFLADGRQRDAILVELFISDCLLQLRRFADVLEKCRHIREAFTELGTRFEVGQALLNEAVAHAGLDHYGAANGSLAEARRLFTAEGNEVWVTGTDLEKAALLLRQGRLQGCLASAQACASTFRVHHLPLREARAQLIAARAAAAMNQAEAALQSLAKALDLLAGQDIPSLTYQSHQLLAALAEIRGDREQARVQYEQAIGELERLQGRLMVEFRADYLEDKEAVYEDMVRFCLEEDQPSQALEYAERAKSRALVDLLAFRLDLRLRARKAEDLPLVEELVKLRAERDRLYRRWEGREEKQEEGREGADTSRRRAREEILSLEKRITALWHRLLIRNADYARDAALWQVHTEPVQPYLPVGTALLEYYSARGQPVAFVVTQEEVQVEWLPCNLTDLQHLIQLLWLNLKAVPTSTAGQMPGLVRNAQGLLRRLHDRLIAPLREALTPYSRLIVVPHGPLHYLPFQALYDGTSYLLQQHEISYLPGASLLRYCQVPDPAASGALAFGHSHGGRLPHALQEAQTVAALLVTPSYLEDQATLARLRAQAPNCRVVHLAAHSEFRPDNPLFSGMALADGWLTTLDLFDMRLDASLVTLSACQTGQSVIGGGDELLGLMRALLYAGAASLVLSLWAVEDRSTAQVMEIFYRRLVEGWTKGAALRYAQQRFLGGQTAWDLDTVVSYAHPYYWASFCLVGDTGPLAICPE